MEGKLFRGGMPTAPDVQKLNERWPYPQIGDRFPYPEVGEIIGSSYYDDDEKKRNRFKTVTEVWRKRLKDRGFVTECIDKTAFVIVDHAHVINTRTVKAVQSAGRKVRKSLKELAVTHPASPVLQAKKFHNARTLYAMEKDINRHKKQILPPSVESLPRLPPPTSDNHPSGA